MLNSLYQSVRQAAVLNSLQHATSLNVHHSCRSSASSRSGNSAEQNNIDCNSEHDPDDDGHSALDELGQTFMCENVSRKTHAGTLGHREHKRGEKTRMCPRACNIQFNDNHMKSIMKSWRDKPQTWMHPENVARLPHDFTSTSSHPVSLL